MQRGLIIVTLLLASASTAVAAPSKSDQKRITDAAAVVRELHRAPDSSIPQSAWDRARCVVVMPDVKKAAFIVGGEHGKGVMSCRRAGAWSAPVFVSLDKASIGAQIGASSTDLVLLVMTERGVDRLLQDKVTLGADASLAAGPVGRSATAETDAQLTAEMLSYSRSRGVFAGIDLAGGVLRVDTDATSALYGPASAHDILLDATRVKTPATARPFIDALTR